MNADATASPHATLRVIRDPEGGTAHDVVEGDSVDSLAWQYGHAGETIWCHPKNEALVAQRGDDRVLFPGDVVYVPERRAATFDGEQTGRRHIYRRLGAPSLLRFRPTLFGESFPGAPFEILRGGVQIGSGLTGPHGDVEYEVMPDDSGVTVRIDFGGFQRDYELAFRELDPVGEVRGVQQRLAELGYYQGDADGRLCDAMQEAVNQFRMRHEIYEGEGLTDAVRDALHKVFGG
ncbi:MAG: peptidoglycan-binding domain-containing protein [Aquabacterium sp.]